MTFSFPARRLTAAVLCASALSVPAVASASETPAEIKVKAAVTSSLEISKPKTVPSATVKTRVQIRGEMAAPQLLLREEVPEPTTTPPPPPPTSTPAPEPAPVSSLPAPEFTVDQADLAASVVEAAKTRLGAPYVWGAAGPDTFDCSGLVQWSYKQVGISLPRVSQDQAVAGTPVAKEDLQPGDVVGFYSGLTHVGIYIGDGKIIHAVSSGIPLQIGDLDSMPFAAASRYV